jgi:hypothetical protein
MFSIAQLTAVVWPAGDGMWIHGFSLNNETNSVSMDRIWDGTPHFKRPMFTIAILFNFPNLYVRLYWIRDIKDSIYSTRMLPQLPGSLIARISLPNMIN